MIEKKMKKIEITLQVEMERFVIKEVEPISPKNMLLIKTGRKNE